MAGLEDLERAAGVSITGGTAGGDVPRSRYIGVPDDYEGGGVFPIAPSSGSPADFRVREQLATRGQDFADERSRLPKYVEGAELLPATAYSAETRARIQNAMAAAGLIGKTETYRLGIWDEVTRRAYKDVLAYANQTGADWQSALNELVASPRYRGDGQPAGGAANQGRVQTVSAPVSLEEQVQQSARQRLGRKLRKQEVDRFVSIYQGIERGQNSAEKAALEQASVGVDTAMTQIPGADAAADQYLDANFAQEEAGVDTLGYLGALEQMLGG